MQSSLKISCCFGCQSGKVKLTETTEMEQLRELYSLAPIMSRIILKGSSGLTEVSHRPQINLNGTESNTLVIPAVL